MMVGGFRLLVDSNLIPQLNSRWSPWGAYLGGKLPLRVGRGQRRLEFLLFF